MRVQKVYLETTIFNFYYTDDAPDKRQDTIKLFDEIKDGKYVPFTSFVALDELKRTKDDQRRENMLALITEYNVGILENNSGVFNLADIYIHEGIIPIKYRDDALHIAAATISEMHIILSWNFEHIVKLKTRHMVNPVNLREGYRTIDICSPKEVVEYDSE